MKKILIAYYSRRGQNYVNGTIVDLKEGNTEAIARKIAEQLDADRFRIDTVDPYPADYTATTEVSRTELRTHARPQLTARVADIEQYDTIVLGYPNWWGTMPMAVCTFLESYNLAGKTIVPYCTHEGSGAGRSLADIRQLCPHANILPCTAIQGAHAPHADAEVRAIIALINS